MRTIRHSLTGYKINYSTNTIKMNYKFAHLAEDYGSPEYNLLRSILKDFPAMRAVVEAGRKIDTTRLTKRLTYQNIKSHIEAYSNASDLLEMFEKAKKLSKPLASPYKYVSDWFYNQFPEFRNSTSSVLRTYESIDLVSLPDINNYNRKENYQA